MFSQLNFALKYLKDLNSYHVWSDVVKSKFVESQQNYTGTPESSKYILFLNVKNIKKKYFKMFF